jgi:hypothetical protein
VPGWRFFFFFLQMVKQRKVLSHEFDFVVLVFLSSNNYIEHLSE